MKKYLDLAENSQQAQEAMKNEYDKLILFQYLLRNCETMNERYSGNAELIASGLQPWIDTLERNI